MIRHEESVIHVTLRLAFSLLYPLSTTTTPLVCERKKMVVAVESEPGTTTTTTTTRGVVCERPFTQKDLY
jgi:hypothetical protein